MRLLHAPPRCLAAGGSEPPPPKSPSTVRRRSPAPAPPQPAPPQAPPAPPPPQPPAPARRPSAAARPIPGPSPGAAAGGRWQPPWPRSGNADVWSALARLTLSLVPHLPPERRLLVGLAGCPGSGKSTCAAEVVARACALAGTEGYAAVLPLDGFHLTRAQLGALPNAEEALARRGAPWTFDGVAFRGAVQAAAAAGRELALPSFDHAAGDPEPGGVVLRPHCRVVIVEGLYVLSPEAPWAEAAPFLDDSWFMDVAPEDVLARVARRHQRAWGLSPAQARARAAGNDAANARLVWATSRDRARLLVPSYDDGRDDDW